MRKQARAGRLPVREFFESGKYSLDEFHDVFIEIGDFTEYKPALQLVGSWAEWCRMKRDWPAFAGKIDEWKSELEVKQRSDALAKIQSLTVGDDAKALAAAKYIADMHTTKRKAGAPSKTEREAAAKEIAKAAGETAAERERILQVINGGK